MPTILVVEDQAEARRPMAKLLRLEGYDVLTAVDAYSAAAAVRNSSPDLMLLDVGIPPMDGLTLLMLLHQEHQMGNVPPVIIVTGRTDESTMTRAKELGAKEFLVKSQFTPDELVATVKRYVQPSPKN